MARKITRRRFVKEVSIGAFLTSVVSFMESLGIPCTAGAYNKNPFSFIKSAPNFIMDHAVAGSVPYVTHLEIMSRPDSVYDQYIRAAWKLSGYMKFRDRRVKLPSAKDGRGKKGIDGHVDYLCTTKLYNVNRQIDSQFYNYVNQTLDKIFPVIKHAILCEVLGENHEFYDFSNGIDGHPEENVYNRVHTIKYNRSYPSLSAQIIIDTIEQYRESMTFALEGDWGNKMPEFNEWTTRAKENPEKEMAKLEKLLF